MDDNDRPHEGAPQAAALDEAAILARFAGDAADVPGHLAYALHRKALLAFRESFGAHHGRAPAEAEEAAFLIGEMSAPRVEAYRAAALAMLAAGGAVVPEPPPPRKARWPWFGMWVDAPLAPPGEAGAINWRGLFGRLAVLMLAVIATALLLRILFTQN